MKRTGLEDAIARELTEQAQETPDSTALKQRLISTVPMLAAGHATHRGIRAWATPLLVAAAVVLVAVGVLAGPQLLRSEHQASPATQVPTPTGPISTVPNTPTPSTKSSVHSPPTKATIPADWFKGYDATKLQHPGLSCPAQLNPQLETSATTSIQIAGEQGPLWLVAVNCNGPTDPSWPSMIEVFRYGASGPVPVQAAIKPWDDSAARTSPRVQKFTVNSDGQSIDLSETAYSAKAPLCCRDLQLHQTLTWAPKVHAFIASDPIQDTQQCTEDQLTVTEKNLTSQSGDARGILLSYQNKRATPCTLQGYPGASAVDRAGRVLQDASRTATGFFGGSATFGPVSVTQSQPASAVMEWQAGVGDPSTKCVDADHFLTTPPGTTSTQSVGTEKYLGLPWKVCGLVVHPVVTGSAGK